MNEFKEKTKALAQSMRAVFAKTPLHQNAYLSDLFGANIYLKREDFSPVRSYKIRGAFNAMRKHPDVRHFVCASAGNHAQGVAFMCQHMEVRGTIFMPVTTPQQKIDKTRMFGGAQVTIELIGDYFDETLSAAQAFCTKEGAHFLSPFDDIDVIEGQATVGYEIEQSLKKVPDVLVFPVGGGGLGAGLISYFGNRCILHAVEPKGGACLALAMEKGRPTALNHVDTFADGAAVGKIGALTFERLKSIDPANLHQVDENRLCATLIEMLNIEGIVLEPAGALAVDALRDIAPQIAGKTVVCITSGGNFDFERLPDVKERAQKFKGLKKYFVLRMPQRPGALKEFLGLLGPDDDITRFEYLKKSARNFGSVLIGIETQDAANFNHLFGNLKEAGFDFQDITDDQILSQFII